MSVVQRAVGGAKKLVQGASVALVVAAPAFAQDTGGGMDTSQVLATIASGLVAVAAIGGAFLGFKYLKKVWNRL